MCPTRCAALYRAMLGDGKKRSAQKAEPKKGKSLIDYIGGGA